MNSQEYSKLKMFEVQAYETFSGVKHFLGSAYIVEAADIESVEQQFKPPTPQRKVGFLVTTISVLSLEEARRDATSRGLPT